MSKKITVVGIGGVGGLLAGVLIRHYGENVSLIARGARAEHLRTEGLTLRSDAYGDFTVKPAAVVADPAELPVQDLVLVCVKNDALESVAQQILPIVGPDTVVLPVMNGVTAAKKLLKILPVGTVPGCVIYTVSGAGADFTITQQGKFTELTVGAQVADPIQQARAVETAAVFTEAGIQCKAVEDVAVAIWTKYVLNCAYNVATARWGCTIGGIKSDESRVEDCRALLTESWKVGVASGVALPEELPEKQLRRILKTSDDSDSSLGRDFAAGRAGEMEVFCGDVIRMAAEYGVDVPMTQKYYDALKDIASRF